MTVYGDLDVSVLDELPPGRTPISTTWHADEADVWPVVRSEVAAGRQAYVVCPLIDESVTLEVRSAEETFAALSAGDLADLRVGLLHGRVGRVEREETMRLFRSGHLDVLVATTVIEVGVDVPNAAVMVVEHAERFGLAQLHQIRGRVGRSDRPSWCFFTVGNASDESRLRLQAFMEEDDGFRIAERDLLLRGSGDAEGARQSGPSGFRIARPLEDLPAFLALARAAGEHLEQCGDQPEGHLLGRLGRYLGPPTDQGEVPLTATDPLPEQGTGLQSGGSLDGPDTGPPC
jgi:ATP-dependent DNA helicase RecG